MFRSERTEYTSHSVSSANYSFMLLNFMGAAILNFMTRYGCRYCYSLEVLLCKTIEQPLHVMKSKMAAPGKFKNENGR